MTSKMPPNGKRSMGANSPSPASEKQGNANAELKARNDIIKQFPKRQIQSGNTVYTGYYDEDDLCVYLCDENGELTGKRAKLQKPLPPLEPEADDTEEPDESENSVNERISEIANSAKEKLQKAAEDAKNKSDNIKKKTAEVKDKHSLITSDSKKRNSLSKKSYDEYEPSHKKNKGIVVAVITLAFLCVGVMGFKYAVPLLQQQLETHSEDEPVVAKEGEIMVIEIKRDVLPGERITNDIIKACNIDSQTYNQVTSNDTDLYRWEQRDNIIDMYSTEYISAGKYISTASVAKTYKVDDNPWTVKAEGMEYVDVPISFEDNDRTKILLGAKVNMHFQISQKEDETSEEKETKALSTRVSLENKLITTQSYSIDNITIADVRTGTDDSLYEIYTALAAVPAGNQEKYLKNAAKRDKEYLSSIAPAKIRVYLDEEYAKALSNAVSAGTVIEMELLEDVDTNEDAKKDFYESELSLMESMASVLK